MKKDKEVLIFTLILVMSELINTDIFMVTIGMAVILYIIKYGILKECIRINKELIIILIIAAVLGMINLDYKRYEIKTYIRDFSNFLTPIIFIIYGIYSKYLKKNTLNIYKSIIISAIILQIRHIILIIINFNLILSGVSIREIGGEGSIVTVVAIIFILSVDSETLHSVLPKKNIRTSVTVFLIMASFCYLSRTNIIILCIGILINIFIQKKFSVKKIVKVLGSAIVLVGLICMIIPQESLEKFTNKFSRSFLEISSKVAYWDEFSINNNWRGYEVYRTKVLLNESSTFENFFGFGFGKKVNLNTSMDLGGTKYSDIPILHNGYYYIILKSGIIGLILYLIFILRISIIGIKKIYRKIFLTRFLLFTSLSILFTTLVVTGIYNKGSIFILCFIIGYTLNNSNAEKNLI